MARILTFITALLACAACSMPERFVLKNNSRAVLVIEFPSGTKGVIAPGESEKILLADILVPGVAVTLDGERCDYRWVRPVAESGGGSPFFRLNLEQDQKIYVMKPGPIWMKLKPMVPQPSGFPLTRLQARLP